MGKRGPKNRYQGKGAKGEKKAKGDWRVRVIPEDNEMFRNYYIQQLGLEQSDFKQFWTKMKQKLPIVFRVNPNCPRYQAFCKKIQNQEFLKNLTTVNEEKDMMKQEQQPQQQNNQPKQLPKLDIIKWYPQDLVYTMNTNKSELKKTKAYTEFHKYLQKAFDSGLISRQELVSMLPPLYLNISPDDIVLDLCAAPGSKTSQLLEMMYGDKRWLAKGCVVANDADYSRAQMLIHQLHRSGTAGMIAINHPGQFMPEFHMQKVGSVKQRFQFDKILCDVPCSGDGATRKIPIKWANWHTSDGMVLHPLQLSILMKGINLLKRGGSLLYSTCSLNPMENEAVINALFQKVGKGLQIVDIHPMFEVKGRRGLLNWKVLAIEDRKQPQMNEQKQIESKKYLREYKTYEQAQHISKIKPSLFPPSQQQAKNIGLHHTMRILPHDQNSGGFYVALLRKLPNFQWRYSGGQKQKMQGKDQAELEQQFLQKNLPEVNNPVQYDDDYQNRGEKYKMEQKKIQEDDQNGQNQQDEERQIKQEKIIEKKQELQQENIDLIQEEQKQKIEQIPQKSEGKKKKIANKGSKYEHFCHLAEQQFQNIKKFFGFDDSIKNLLYVRENADLRKKVILVSEGVRKFLQADHQKKLKLVNMGTQAFQRSKQSFAGDQCFYRICQDGIHFLLDYMTKRKIKVPLQFFKKIIPIKSLAHQKIEDPVIREQVSKLSQGSFCFYIDEVIEGKRIVDAVVGQNFKNSFHTMVSKQDTQSLIIRYL